MFIFNFIIALLGFVYDFKNESSDCNLHINKYPVFAKNLIDPCWIGVNTLAHSLMTFVQIKAKSMLGRLD